MKRLYAVLAAAVLLAALLAGCGQAAPVPAVSPTFSPSDVRTSGSAAASEVRFAESRAEIFALMQTETVRETSGSDLAIVDKLEEAPSPDVNAFDFSVTNVQTEGIDEGDIIKTDGRCIYALYGGELVILAADGAETRRLSSYALDTYSESSDAEGYDYYLDYSSKAARELYICGSSLVVISDVLCGCDRQKDGRWEHDYSAETCVELIDVSDPEQPAPLTAFSQDGAFHTSRLYDGRLYVISSFSVCGEPDENDPGSYIPGIRTDGQEALLDAGCIAVIPNRPSDEYSVICVYDAEIGSLLHSAALLDSAGRIYMSASGIYLASREPYEEIADEWTEEVYTVSEHICGARTRITRFDISDGLSLSASGTVPGQITDQFALDEHNGYLRVVTTDSTSRYTLYLDEAREFTNYGSFEESSANGLYILSPSLSIIGRVDGLAGDEVIYSARFDGDTAYFVTFRQTDPLFAVDLSDPAAPRVLSELKLPGFSEYLHPWDDGLLLGLGLDADEETGQTGSLKLSMFDVSDPADVREQSTLVLDGEYSEALYNHRAILVSKSRNFIGFPDMDGYSIYGYTEGAGFEKRADIPCDGWYNARGLYIGEYAYIVGGCVNVLDLSELTLAAAVPMS